MVSLRIRPSLGAACLLCALLPSMVSSAVVAQPTGTALGASSGTTVITHGFQFGGTRPNWPLLMAAEIAQSVRSAGGSARVLVYRPTQEPVLAVCVDTALCGVSDPVGHSIVVVDWAAISNQSGRGFSEAAGEALAAVLLAEVDEVDLATLHFIGHSRGTVVNSEAAERLIAAGFTVDQMTALDTHDWGIGRSPERAALVPASEHAWSESDISAERGGFDDFDVNELHPEYNCGQSQGGASAVCAWAEVGYVDSYYQRDGIFDLWGRAIQGASNLEFLNLGLSHGDVHCWYRASISGGVGLQFPGDGCTEGDVSMNWFTAATQCIQTDRSSPLSRSADGFNVSAAALGTDGRCPDGTPRQAVLFDAFSTEGLVNGDFEKDGTAGWQSQGGGFTGTLSSEGDNRFVRLEQGEQLLHSWSFLPQDAGDVRFRYRVPTTDAAADLVLTAKPYGAPEMELRRTALGVGVSDWLATAVPLPKELLGTTLKIGVRVDAAPTSSAVLEIDSFVVDVMLDGLLFADGFETGSLDQWSLVSP